jgi:hypothetical protein
MTVEEHLIATYVGEMAEYFTFEEALALAIERDEEAAREFVLQMIG